MNSPEYILTDEMELIVESARAALDLPSLNYQYGYIEELNITLQEYEQDRQKFDVKFPLVWLAEPYTMDCGGDTSIYGSANIDLFLIASTDINWKAAERMANNYKPLLHPLANEILRQLSISEVFNHQVVEQIKRKITKGYYWGTGQQAVLNDSVDCLKLSITPLRVNNKDNCTILTNL